MSRAREFADLAGSADAGGLTGKNLLINGAMQVNQRGTKTSSDGNDAVADRFLMFRNGTDVRFTLSTDTDVPAGQGFTKSAKIDVTTADTSFAAGDLIGFRQQIEGKNVQHLKKGTSNAESLTLSFYIKSSITGTYILELYDFDNGRQISKSYTVSSANTWEKKTLTFPGDTTGAFDNDNNRSLLVHWWLGAGSTYQSGTLNTSWASVTQANRVVGQVNAINSTDNNILITGCQLEIGQKATPFEHRSFADELHRCSRYLKQYKATTTFNQFAFAHTESTTLHNALFTFDPPMRDTPNAITVSGNIGIITQWGLGVTGISSVALDASSKGFTQTRLRCTTGSGVGTAGETNILLSNNNASSTINFDAEM